MPFVKGQSGNPGGRPPGSRNRRTLLNAALFAERSEEVVNTLVNRAVMGDMAAMRLCVAQIAPRGRDLPVEFALPGGSSPAETERALADIKAGLAAGELTTQEAFDLVRLVKECNQTVAAAHAALRVVEHGPAADDRKAVAFQGSDPSTADAAPRQLAGESTSSKIQ